MGVSGSEIFVIFLFILIFFGADKIPEFARTLGKGVREFKKAADDIKSEINNHTADIKEEVNGLKDDIKEYSATTQTQFKKMSTDLEDSVNH